jgi:hypothetical protein
MTGLYAQSYRPATDEVRPPRQKAQLGRRLKSKACWSQGARLPFPGFPS